MGFEEEFVAIIFTTPAIVKHPDLIFKLDVAPYGGPNCPADL